MVFFIDEARSRPPPRLLTNVNKKMVFFIEGFPNAKYMFIADIQCPDPNGYVTELIMIDQSVTPLQLPLQYGDSFRYRYIFSSLIHFMLFQGGDARTADIL